MTDNNNDLPEWIMLPQIHDHFAEIAVITTTRLRLLLAAHGVEGTKIGKSKYYRTEQVLPVREAWRAMLEQAA